MSIEKTIETHEAEDRMARKENAAEDTGNTPNGLVETFDCMVTLPKSTDKHKSQSLLETALTYAHRDWPVFPVWEIEDRQCVCGKEDCSSPGKHPRTSHGDHDATTDMSHIEDWWRLWPNANIGIATGEASGLSVLDIDPRNGGDESLAELEQQHGSLPHTVETVTGGKGRHFYFAYPKGVTISNSAGKLGPGLDVRGSGGSIIAPGSRHVSGGQYVWKDGHSPEETDFAELPEWLLQRLQSSQSSRILPAITDGKIREGQRNETLFHAACCLRGRGLEQAAIETTLHLHNLQLCEPPLGAAEVQAIAASASSFAINTEGEEGEWVKEMNALHAVVRVVGKTVILNDTYDPVLKQKDITLSTPTDLTHWYKNQTIPRNGRQENVATVWIGHEHRRQYQGIIFSPKREVPGYYNLWQGFAVEPKEGDCSLYLEHIKDNIAQGDNTIYRYVVSWMAQCVKEPDQRPGVAIVLRGKQGTGKGVFVTQFGKLFGKHFVHVTNPKHLLGNFNAHLKDALVVFADEAFWAGDKASEGALKAMVTEEQLTIEFKGKDAFSVQNHIRLFVASNHDWVVPAGLEERRFCVLDMSEQSMQNQEYFGKIVRQMDQGGREALLHLLLNYDLTGINLREFPQTQALQENKFLSMSTPEKFWFGCLKNGSFFNEGTDWETCVPKQEVTHAYMEFAKGIGQSRKACETELGMGLKKLVPGLKDSTRTEAGIRRRHWLFPELKTCRDYFDKITKSEHEWPE